MDRMIKNQFFNSLKKFFLPRRARSLHSLNKAIDAAGSILREQMPEDYESVKPLLDSALAYTGEWVSLHLMLRDIFGYLSTKPEISSFERKACVQILQAINHRAKRLKNSMRIGG